MLEIMKYYSSLHNKLSNSAFVYTAEVTPPDASDKETLLKKTLPFCIIITLLLGIIGYILK